MDLLIEMTWYYPDCRVFVIVVFVESITNNLVVVFVFIQRFCILEVAKWRNEYGNDNYLYRYGTTHI